jgi:Uma2 family endonuclease
VANLSSTKLLSPRTRVQLFPDTIICPDLALVARATGKLWLAAEVVNSGDHQPDTVLKKEVYEKAKLPRLWMIDPRYDNVETYQGSEYGLALKEILAGKQALVEKLIPEFHLVVSELFAG